MNLSNYLFTDKEILETKDPIAFGFKKFMETEIDLKGLAALIDKSNKIHTADKIRLFEAIKRRNK